MATLQAGVGGGRYGRSRLNGQVSLRPVEQSISPEGGAFLALPVGLLVLGRWRADAVRDHLGGRRAGPSAARSAALYRRGAGPPRAPVVEAAAAKFCDGCAAPFPLRCPSCGASNRTSAKFCIECAAPLGVVPVDETVDPHDLLVLFMLHGLHPGPARSPTVSRSSRGAIVSEMRIRSDEKQLAILL